MFSRPPTETYKKVSYALYFSPEFFLTVDIDVAGRHSVGAPIQVYPLYENGFRARRGQSIKENHEESAKLYGDFNEVAQSNPYAWGAGSKETASSIGTISKKNRMICFPCKYGG